MIMVCHDIMKVALVGSVESAKVVQERRVRPLRRAALPFSTAELPTFAQFVRERKANWSSMFF